MAILADTGVELDTVSQAGLDLSDGDRVPRIPPPTPNSPSPLV